MKTSTMKLPLRLPHRVERFPRDELRLRHLADHAHDHRVSDHQHDDEEARHDAGVDHLVEFDAVHARRHLLKPGDDSVDEQRQAREECDAECATAGHETERELLGVAVFDERREEQAADGDDRDAAGAGEDGEGRRRENADDSKTTRQRSEDGARNTNKTLGRVALAHQIASERKDRDRRQHGHAREMVAEDVFDRACEWHRGDVLGAVQPEEQCEAAQEGEERCAHQCQAREDRDAKADRDAVDADAEGVRNAQCSPNAKERHHGVYGI